MPTKKYVSRRYPSTRLRSILRSYEKTIRLSKQSEILVFLSYILFLQKLGKEARNQALSQRQKIVTVDHVEEVLQLVLKQMRG
ncbi:centromere protein W-like [Limulus polyphemus]|uniref:Centromere protein W-like n=1 Tax=Limulus polyphemus TaxID=6850 RepID=A0ABM1TNF8_LIMPO|nr:centromere protein W-like [Limulus polyphemus]